MNTITTQKPINSKFGAKTTAKKIAKKYCLKGKNVIVTGGYSGIGLEITKVLAQTGASVLVPARNIKKAQTALKKFSNVEIEYMDLLNPKSIDDFSTKFILKGKPLHILINSAGIMAPLLKRDSRGYESQFSANHLGHFHLTAKLWPALVKAKGARVIAVSSRAQRWGGVNFDDPNFLKAEYDPMKAYAQSKSANVLFAVELDKNGKKFDVRAFAVHPGLIPSTNLGSSSLEEKNKGLKKIIVKFSPQIMRIFHVSTLLNILMKLKKHHIGDEFKNIKQGAATPVWCAISNELNGMGGVYCEDCNIAVTVNDGNSPYGVLPWAIDAKLATKLWSLSEKLIGIKFEI